MQSIVYRKHNNVLEIIFFLTESKVKEYLYYRKKTIIPIKSEVITNYYRFKTSYNCTAIKDRY